MNKFEIIGKNVSRTRFLTHIFFVKKLDVKLVCLYNYQRYYKIYNG